ncbi:DSC E3 ubiquitin ligase complex subunit 2 [Purpureocillium lavendulum]|uniref:DSC E3 ubiquitin ligase complex subunit 2 n=1 Tax=Purpureocillium lavendulum TaxID=1247861 RepID=A0AB34FRP8_9HYPO|nr:DSC E3 ubiquitin ligase complex subunit 2 [Purpureocillium lavendulum]
MDQQPRKPPRRKDNRVILQFDYDCFYAQVFENKNPALKTRPLGIKQKNILATCNYNARKLGVGKLMLISEAKRICPGLVLVDGEDLTPFRDVSKTLFNFLRSHSWNGKVERLGFDEVFMGRLCLSTTQYHITLTVPDVTDMIDYNILCVNSNCLDKSFFHLSEKDPERGFPCDLTVVAGCVSGPATPDANPDDRTHLRLRFGSHLAHYLRSKLETEFGYTSTCGISTNKLLSKLVGSCNKPRNQTTLLAWKDDDVIAFMDAHKTRKVPGLGFKIAMLLESHVLGYEIEADSHSFDSHITVGQVRQHPSMSPGFLETLLKGPGAERGVGARVWGLLHGVDEAEVKEASDIPSQVSIEDTFKGLETIPQITEELHKLSCSLIRRLRVDLVVVDESADVPGFRKWIARPKTLRLSIRSWPTRQGSYSSQAMNFNRVSRSGPLPTFVFDLEADMESLAQRLVAEALLPLLRRLQAEQGQNHKWNLQLLNICAANMVVGAADDKMGAGRDIAFMFKHQDEALRPWKVTQSSDEDRRDADIADSTNPAPVEDEDSEGDVTWDSTTNAADMKTIHRKTIYAKR